jgi:ElaA protein
MHTHLSMQLQFQWARFESLSALEVYEIIQARESVFVVEQQCPYQEVDGLDLHAWHLRARVGDALAAYARIVDPGLKYAQPSIGRVMTVRNFRAHGFGRPLMREAIRFTHQAFPGQGIRISAQARLKLFYESLGFAPDGPEYSEDGIPHIDMTQAG